MQTHASTVRQIITGVCALAVIAAAAMPIRADALGAARYELRPHCTGENELESVFGGPLPDSDHFVGLTDGRCPSFEVRDPENLQTPVLNPGDTLDMDLIIHNPERQPISRFRAWIAYDASALDGVDVEINPAFPVPTPGETAFFSQEGFLKVSGTANQPLTDEKIVVARVRMRVAEPRFEGTPLSYFDLSDSADSRTGIFTTSGTTEANVLAPNPGYLFVRFNAPAGNQTSSVASQGSSSLTSSLAASSVSSAMESSSSSSSSSGAPSTVFTMLQVQGLRVTTEGSSVFLAWDALPSTELVGYNVYYGTTMGSYIQRRGVDKSANSIVIRALPEGVTYYFAIRAVNERGQESEFSQEVGISVGNPRTSTSPLDASSLPVGTPGTNGSVAGETGVSSVLLVFLTLSAVIGTVLAFRRQWAVSAA